MAETKIPIWRSVAAGYRDGSRALWAMPALAGIAFLISLAYDWAYRSLRSSAPTRDLGYDTLLAAMVLLAIATFLRTPILIAVHRFVLRDEVTAGYRLDPSDPRFRRFFGWWLSLSLMPLLPAWLGRLARSGNPDVVLRMLRLVLIVPMLVGCVLLLRLTILLPAIAVDAPGATWQNAYRDTRSYVLRLFGIVMLAVLPLLPVLVLLLRAAPISMASITPLVFMGLALGSSVTVFYSVVLYQRIGDRVKQPGA